MNAVTDNLDLYWDGFLRSLGICLWGLVGSLVLGTLVATFRVSPGSASRSNSFILDEPVSAISFQRPSRNPASGSE